MTIVEAASLVLVVLLGVYLVVALLRPERFQ
jgi:K+-transporting ATPase KdpF subunit